MRIKQIIAANMTEALAQIKSELGDDAIIISSDKTQDGKISVSVAIDEKEEFFFDEEEKIETVSSADIFEEQHLRDCLEYGISNSSPLSKLQKHSDVTVIADYESSLRLSSQTVFMKIQKN